MSATDWTEAFVKAQAEFPTIPKTKTADMGTYSYSYADLGDTIEAVRPILTKHGLAFAQSAVTEDDKIGIETRIYHTAGHVEVFGPLYLPAGGDARAAGSAVTYARRYSLTAALGITSDEDADGAGAETSPDEGAETESPPDPHNRAWAVVSDLLGPDEAEVYFKAAIESYGLEVGKDRLNAKQAHGVIANLPGPKEEGASR
jgi:hypothetical protein